ncbi:MAG: universal stress protein [Candidatus Aminicenantia bacterium]
METIVLALSTTRQSPRTIEYSLDLAQKESAKLIVLFIVDPGLPKLIFEKLIDMGFMGEKPSKQVVDAILKEYRERGKEQLEEIRKSTRSMNIECQTIITQGEFVKECLKIIKKEKPKQVILTRAKRTELSRFLFGSAVNELKKKSPSPIKVIEEI